MSKTLRQFQCRDDLWARVEALAKRRGISTDDVVQAALMQLFKSKTKKEGETSGMMTAPPQAAASGPSAPAPRQGAGPVAAARPTIPPPSGAPGAMPRPPGVRPPGSGPAPTPPTGTPISPSASATMNAGRTPSPLPQPRLPKPTTSPVMPVAPSTTPPNPAPAAAATTPTPAANPTGPAKAAPSLPRPPTQSRLPPPAGAAASKARPLYLMFEGQWYEVDKEEYVIGRGQKFSDLPIKDANISRRHCSVVRRGGDYFIKDLGSTNGVEFEGQRVDNHKILEGSVYFLCDHEIRFSFTPPGQAS